MTAPTDQVLPLELKSDLRGIETWEIIEGCVPARELKSDLRGIETSNLEMRQDLTDYQLKSDLRGIETQ